MRRLVMDALRWLIGWRRYKFTVSLMDSTSPTYPGEVVATMPTGCLGRDRNHALSRVLRYVYDNPPPAPLVAFVQPHNDD